MCIAGGVKPPVWRVVLSSIPERGELYDQIYLLTPFGDHRSGDPYTGGLIPPAIHINPFQGSVTETTPLAMHIESILVSVTETTSSSDLLCER